MVWNHHPGGEMWDVAVIGAGIAGLTAARHLHRAGYRVLVLEKSRGLGGRLATRRVDGQPIDHGCPYISPFQMEDSTLISPLLAANILHPWCPKIFELDAADRLHPQATADAYYVAPLGMTAVAKYLATGLVVNRQWRVTHLSYRVDHWQLRAETSQGTVASVSARAVVAAVPAPQLLTLVRQLEDQCQVSDLVQQLASVKFAPVMTVMAAYDSVAECPLTSPEVTHAGWMVCGQGHGAIRWAGLDSSKRTSSSKSVVVIHSTPTFAQNYLTLEDLSIAGHALIEVSAVALGPWVHHPGWVQTHRWRYGFVDQALDCPSLTAETLPHFVACGDWCMGPNVEAALKSGQQAARQIMQSIC
jgi:renalase